MENKVKNDIKEIEESLYQTPKVFKFQLFILSSTLLALGFLFNFPLGNIINSNIEKAISSNPACPIMHGGTEFSFFFPSITIKNPTISAKCFGGKSDIALKDIELNLVTPSFSPIGLRFSTQLSDGKSTINLSPVLSYPTQKISIQDSKIKGSFFNNILQQSNLINGDLLIDALVELKDGDLDSGDFHLKSKNLSIPSQSVQGFDLPLLNFELLSLKGALKNQKHLNIQTLILGGPKSPIQLQLAGKIELNKKSINQSNYDLNGEIKFAPTFLEAFPILTPFLVGKKNADGFYRVKLKGSFNKLSMPQIL